MSFLGRIFHPAQSSRTADYEAAATIIESFANGSAKQWDWDDFISIRKRDAFLESVRSRCVRVYDDFPAQEERAYCSPAGVAVLRSLAAEVRERMRGIQGMEGA